MHGIPKFIHNNVIEPETTNELKVMQENPNTIQKLLEGP